MNHFVHVNIPHTMFYKADFCEGMCAATTSVVQRGDKWRHIEAKTELAQMLHPLMKIASRSSRQFIFPTCVIGRLIYRLKMLCSI